MQKLLRRTAQAKAQASRRAKLQFSKTKAETRRIRNFQVTQFNKGVAANLKQIKQVRREDLLLGPLAPRRDVGNKKTTYGMLDPRMLSPPGTQGIAIEKKKKQEEWTGIRGGDRVVVVGKKERDYGKVGVVKEVRWGRAECVVEGVNLADVKNPGASISQADQKIYRTVPAPIPLSSVRLIYPLPPSSDPTAPPVDTLIQSLTRLPNRPGRYISGLDPPVRIPWPQKEKVEYQDHDIDSLRIDVEQETWIPTLLRAPIPGTVIDELRNKYSVFRTRHEESYVAKIEKKEAREARRQERRRVGWKQGMMTPVREMLVRRRMEKLSRGEGEEEVSEEVLGRIGEVMARNRGLDGAIGEGLAREERVAA